MTGCDPPVSQDWCTGRAQKRTLNTLRAVFHERNAQWNRKFSFLIKNNLYLFFGTTAASYRPVHRLQVSCPVRRHTAGVPSAERVALPRTESRSRKRQWCSWVSPNTTSQQKSQYLMEKQNPGYYRKQALPVLYIQLNPIMSNWVFPKQN